MSRPAHGPDDYEPPENQKTEAECVICGERFWVEFPCDEGHVVEVWAGSTRIDEGDRIVCDWCLENDERVMPLAAALAQGDVVVSDGEIVEQQEVEDWQAEAREESKVMDDER